MRQTTLSFVRSEKTLTSPFALEEASFKTSTATTSSASSPNLERPFTDEEWQNGKSDIVPIRSPQSGEIEPTSGSEVSYRGKRFHFSGQHFGDAQPSPTGAWLSLQSFDGDYDPKDSLIPNHGTFHVDVFSTRRGTKQFSVSANVDHQEPGTPARGIRWIGDSYIFLDLFPDEQKFLLCDATKRTN